MCMCAYEIPFLSYYIVSQSDITDVNQIFKDLAMLVHEQGEVIGKISTRCQLANQTSLQCMNFKGKVL